ncbi:MAG: DUF2249 domain-containing protein [Rhodobacteraceae bacterium]|nr:DUF2249 domain-containing protein [Paracoccaceae bacterium]
MHIETRGLNPPDPAVAILWHIDRPEQNGPVTVYLDRHPIYLFPELVERGWHAEVISGESGNVRLILRPRA